MFVDLSAAYATLNYRLCTHTLNVNNMHLTNMVKTLIENRGFFVELSEKKSRWLRQKNGLPQGSVMAQLCSTSMGVDLLLIHIHRGGGGVDIFIHPSLMNRYYVSIYAHVNIYVNDQPVSALRPEVSFLQTTCVLPPKVMTSLRQKPPYVRDLPTYPCTTKRTI